MFPCLFLVGFHKNHQILRDLWIYLKEAVITMALLYFYYAFASAYTTILWARFNYLQLIDEETDIQKG